MNIAIVIPVWKRPEVTRFCFAELKHMIASVDHTVEVVCVISEQEYIPTCAEFGFKTVWSENDQLGKKINAGVKYALSMPIDYIVMMNSDDVIEPELINKWYRPYFENRTPFFGINRVTYVNFGTDKARNIVYDFSILGIAKCIRADVAQMAFKRKGYLYTPQLNRGLDDAMLHTIMQLGISPTIVQYAGQLAFDFKSDVNIWPWERFKNKGTSVCYKRGYDRASSTAG